MPASRFHRLSSVVWLATAAIGLWTPPAAAVDVYFPATNAYHRRNYDPFDDVQPAVAESTVWPSAELLPPSTSVVPAGSATESGDIQLLGPAPDERNLPFAAQPVVPAAMQSAPAGPTAPEPLPQPPRTFTEAAPTDEPGSSWTPTPLADLTTNTVLPSGLLPRDHWAERTLQPVAFFDPCGTTRGWPVNTYNWVASCLCHNPLYFEQVNLERYGYGCSCYGPCCTNGVQSLCSAAHFFGSVAALPYMMGADCPFECDYTLGYYRPGSCPPYRYQCPTHCSALGGLSAGGVATGLVFLIP